MSNTNIFFEKTIDLKTYKIKFKYSELFIKNIQTGFFITINNINNNIFIYEHNITYDIISNSIIIEHNDINNILKIIKSNPELIFSESNTTYDISKNNNYLILKINFSTYNFSLEFKLICDTNISTSLKEIEDKLIDIENKMNCNTNSYLKTLALSEIINFSNYSDNINNISYYNFCLDLFDNNKLINFFNYSNKLYDTNIIINEIKDFNDLYKINFIKPTSILQYYNISDNFNITKKNVNIVQNYFEQALISNIPNLIQININLNFLLSKNILLKKIKFINSNSNIYKNNDINFLSFLKKNISNIVNLFINNNDSIFEYDFELLNNDHNINKVFFEIINENNINVDNRKYIYKSNFYNIFKYGIYIIEN